jgi:hypothetical protein
VGILASALPGFRDLRAPLIAGYLWLLFVWLLIDPELPPPADHGNGFVDTLIDLGDVVGTVGIAVAVSVAAYLIGAISQTVSSVGAWLLRKVGDLLLRSAGAIVPDQWLRRLPAVRTAPATARLASIAEDRVTPQLEQVDELGRRIDNLEGVRSDNEPRKPLPEVRRLRDDLGKARESVLTEGARLEGELQRELSLPATLLIGERPETFAEADRIRGEGDLRLAVAPPLVALTLLLGDENPVWYLGFIAILALAIQGLVKADDARGVVAAAIIFGKGESAALQRWDNSAIGMTEERDRLEERRKRLHEDLESKERERRGQEEQVRYREEKRLATDRAAEQP